MSILISKLGIFSYFQRLDVKKRGELNSWVKNVRIWVLIIRLTLGNCFMSPEVGRLPCQAIELLAVQFFRSRGRRLCLGRP